MVTLGERDSLPAPGFQRQPALPSNEGFPVSKKGPEPYDFRLTFCMLVVPWVSTVGAAVFAAVFVGSLNDLHRDTPAMTIALMLAILALFSWYNRLLLRDLLRELPPRRPGIEP